MTHDPLVSVIMPVYNAGAFVKEAIQSVLTQTYTRLELLVIDDGSTDNSKDEILAFKDSRIVYLEQLNAGVSAARNAGLRKMNGDFFCFLDADDQLPPDSIKSRLKVFETSEAISFVDGAVEIFDESMTRIKRLRKAAFSGPPFQELLKINPDVFFGPSWMVRRKQNFAYQFDENLTHTEDLWFYFSISEQGVFSFTDSVILKYRSHPHSAMSKLDALARGYTQLTALVLTRFGSMSLTDRVMWMLRIRKIMALSFAGNGSYFKGIRYFLTGH